MAQTFSARVHIRQFLLGLIFSLVAMCSTNLLAQVTGGIEGIVKDGSGALVSGATVTITNTGTNAVRNGTTDNAGLYNFVSLPPGPYTVRIEGPGFKTSLRNLTLEVQQTAQVDFSLVPGAADQTIEVTAVSSAINATDATVGTVIQEKQVKELPLNGRDFLQLAALSSNVTTNFPSPGQATLRQGGSRAAENYSVSGLRGTSNYYTLDGVSNTDVNFNLIIMQPSIDAIQEFKVQTGVYPAQFGREAAQINVSTKSGTNAYHGTVFEFLRNDVLDAKAYDFAGTKPAKNPFKWNQFGFTLGGPVVIPKLFDGHNKLFFLSNFEEFRLRQSGNSLFTVPTLAMRSGDFSNLLTANQLFDPSTKTSVGGVNKGIPFAGNIIAPSKINPVSTLLLRYIPLPNVGSATKVVNNYQTSVGNPLNKGQFTQRVDYNQNDRTTWFARYTFANEDSTTGGAYLNGSAVTTNAKQAVLGNTRVLSPTKVNDVRIVWNNFKNVSGTQLAGVTDVVDTLGIPGLSTPNPLTWGIPQVGGFSDGISTFGNSTSAPFVLNDQTYQAIDNFTWTLGKHSLQIGADIRRDQYNYFGNEFGRGQFLFNGTETRAPGATTGGESFADFLTGYCSTCVTALSLAQTQNRATSQNYYVDDTWRATTKLSINAGLRYEFVPPYYDKSQNSVNTIMPSGAIPSVAGVTDPTLQPTLYRAGAGDFYQGHETVRFASPIQTSRQSLYGGNLVSSDYADLAPRLGVVYSPSEAWSIRAGFGIFYSQDSGIEFFDLARGFGRVSVADDPGNPSATYQNFIPTGGAYVTLTRPNVFGIVPNLRTPYYNQYVLNLQHDLTKGTLLEVGYAGNSGHHLWGLQNLNAAVPGATGSTASRSPFNYLGIIQALQSSNYSNYNAFTAKLTHRASAGLTYTASYTFSKSLDDSSAIRGTASDILPQNSRCLSCDYGPSGFNIPHRFVTSVLYELPVGRGKRFLNSGGFLNELIGGWQVGSIVSAQSGIPVNTQTGIDTAGTGGYGEIRLNTTGVSPNYAKGQRTLSRWWNPAAFTLPVAGTFGNAQRNYLQAPHFVDWDASLLKNFHIHQEQSLQFRFETFNTANHPNFGVPNPSWSSTSITTPGASFATITTTANAMRQMQAALKFNF